MSSETKARQEIWIDRFKEYTSGAFVLTLSANHCEMLMAFLPDGMAVDSHKLSKKPKDTFVSVMKGLERRGLVVHDNQWGKEHQSDLLRGIYYSFRLTEAGKLVRGLLYLAGRE